MTISPQYFASTESLIRPGKTKFYPLDIPIPHPQLRHFISTVDQDWVYFASSYDIYALHLPSQRKSLLATLPFSPRCLAAGLGWICIGGEQNGDSAFIQLNKKGDDTFFQENHSSALEPSRSTTRKTLPGLGLNDTSPRSHPELVLNELGGEIVNSITLHELSNKGRSNWNEPVALVSNNDKTVKIYSLLQQQILANLPHPFPMNYALISPDSEILVTVGDSGQAYFYRRKPAIAQASPQDRFPKYEWEVLAKPRLARGERTNDDHSFSITFSPSGHLCAISAQGGMVSVFDMEIITNLADVDAESYGSAIVCSFKSSRSGICGSVRSMAFSPGPWDLLAWAEDHGRAGIADVRQAFCRRQIIKLETHASDLERIIPEDMTDPYVKGLDVRGRLIHQYQENFHPQNAMNSAESRLGGPEDWSDGASLQRQESRRAGLADLDAREQSVLDTLEVTMEDVDDAINNVPNTSSVNYRSFPHLRTSVESEERSPSRAQLESLIDVFRERNLQRIRGGDRQYQPRRRNSIVLSQGAGSNANGTSRLTPGSISRSRITASPSRMPDSEAETHHTRLAPNMSANDLSPTVTGSDTLPPPPNVPPSDPWHVIQSALDPPARPTSVPIASRLTPPSSHHDGSDGAEGDTVSHLPSSESRSTERTSARTSTLPTTLNSTQLQTPSRFQADPNLLRRAVPLSELETERHIRRLTSATADLEGRDGHASPRAYANDERHLRILEARILARQRLAARELEPSSPPPPASSRTPATQRSELIGRATPADLRLARQMTMQSARNMMDRNGNWMPGEALERLLGRSRVGDANGSGGGAVAREIGVGTAGVGWSPDGRRLYIGTEEGIFEYDINLMDRKTFPALDLR